MQYAGGLVALIDFVGENRIRGAADRFLRTGQYWRTYDLSTSDEISIAKVIFGLVFAFGALVLLVTAAANFGVIPDLPVWAYGIAFISAIGGLLLSILFGPRLVGRALVPIAHLSGSPVNLKFIGFVIVTIGFVFDFLAS